MVVATGEMSKQFGGVLRLNGSGSLLWDVLAGGANREALIAALLDAYEVDRETAEGDADAFVATLREAGVLDE